MSTIFQILVVEDNPADAHLMKQLIGLFDAQCEITILIDGDQAIDFLNRTGTYASVPRPDLIFLDLNLPKMDGREVLTRVKADENLKQIPVLVLSTSTSPKDVKDSYTLGANAFLAKQNGLDEMDELLKQTASFWLKAAILSDRFIGKERR